MLAIFPSTRGFGFAVFEGSRSLIDWGVKGVRGARKNPQSLRKLRELLEFYRPDVLVIADGVRSRRGRRIRQLIGAVIATAQRAGVAMRCFSRADVRACFVRFDARTKREIALAVAREFPELEPRLPPVRRIWMSEDARMNIFDAVALGMTYFYIEPIKT